MDACSTILAINPTAQVSVKSREDGSEDLDQIIWHSGTEVISKSDIQAKQAELKADYDAKEYQRLRQPEYPTIAELVVALYDTDDKADIDKRRADVKAKYPKL